MEPAWNELEEAFENSKSKLIGGVDCTSEEAEQICGEMGIEGFPTLKWGDVYNLEEYEGSRDFESLKKFADKHLKPMCGVNNIQLCDKATRKEIRRLKKLSLEELDQEMYVKTEELNKVEAGYKEFLSELETTYEEAQEKKDAKIKEIKNSGLGLMKAVASERGIKADKTSDPTAEGDQSKDEL